MSSSLYFTIMTSCIIGPFLCCHLLYLIIYLSNSNVHWIWSSSPEPTIKNSGKYGSGVSCWALCTAWAFGFLSCILYSIELSLKNRFNFLFGLILITKKLDYWLIRVLHKRWMRIALFYNVYLVSSLLMISKYASLED